MSQALLAGARKEGISPLTCMFSCAPGRIRTCDQRIRSPTLYPAELRAPDHGEDAAARSESVR
jgi:hypothetical protein